MADQRRDVETGPQNPRLCSKRRDARAAVLKAEIFVGVGFGVVK